MKSPIIPPPLCESTPLDAKRYPRFLEVGAFQAYAYFDGDQMVRQQQKESFLRGECEWPVLDYPFIQATKLDEREQGLSNLKNDILAQETNLAVKRAYLRKVAEKLAEVRMLRATLVGDDQTFQKYTEFVYGKPSPEVFVDDCQAIEELIQRASVMDSFPALTDAIHQVRHYFPSRITTTLSGTPQVQLVDLVRQKTIDAMHDLFLDVPDTDGQLFTAPQIQQAFADALHTLGIEDWQVMITISSTSTISVNHETKTIKIPQERKLSAKKLQLLLAHEIGTHVLRRQQGETSCLQLLGLGLDRYERGEEGIATLREQVLDGEYEDDVGLDKHLAISLVYGLDGTPRTFREVFERLKSYRYLVCLVDGFLIQRAAYLSSESARSTCMRIFRGTHGTHGVCFTKDAIYKEGNRAVWKLLAHDIRALEHFPLGKYDPTNARHLDILHELGILPKVTSS